MNPFATIGLGQCRISCGSTGQQQILARKLDLPARMRDADLKRLTFSGQFGPISWNLLSHHCKTLTGRTTIWGSPGLGEAQPRENTQPYIKNLRDAHI
jgi:hypothetical protein